MAQYKRIPYEMVEHTELAEKSYLDYERGKDAPDEAETEAEWIEKRKKLRVALNSLTSRQREVYVLKVAYRLTEAQIADRLNVSQSAVSQHYQAAQARLKKTIGETTDK